MSRDQEGMDNEVPDSIPQRIVDSATTIVSMDPRWRILRLTTETGSVDFRITEFCAED